MPSSPCAWILAVVAGLALSTVARAEPAELQRALEQADLAFRQDPGSRAAAQAAMAASLALAKQLIASGTPAEAAALCERAQDYDRDDWRPAYLRGVALLKAGRVAEAQLALERARGMTDKNRVLWALGGAYFRQEQWHQAAGCFSELVDRGQTKLQVLYKLGVSCWNAGQGDRALECFRQAQAQAPDDAGLAAWVAKLEHESTVEANYQSTDHGDFTVSFERTDEQREVEERLTGVLTAALRDVERLLWVHQGGQIPVVVYASDQKYREGTDIVSWALAHWDGKLRIPIEAARELDRPEVALTLRHELVHMLVAERYRDTQVPAWLNEGLAQLAEGREEPNRRNLLRDTVSRRDGEAQLLPLASLTGCFSGISSPARAQLAYAEAYFAVKFLTERPGVRGATDVLDSIAGGEPHEDALYRNTGADYARFQKQWVEWLRRELRVGA